MDWDAIGAIGEIVGASAVLISLFYVGLQVRQNSKAIRGQTYESLSTTLANFSQSNRSAWFQRPEQAYQVLWWVSAGDSRQLTKVWQG